MVALQLLSHLEGDALNVPLLVPEATQVTQIGLVGALTDHYDLPRRIADYRRQFEKIVRLNLLSHLRHLQSRPSEIWARTLEPG